MFLSPWDPDNYFWSVPARVNIHSKSQTQIRKKEIRNENSYSQQQIAKKKRSKDFLFQFHRIEYILIPHRLSVMQTFALVRLVENIPVI